MSPSDDELFPAAPPRKVALVVEYDGTMYAGFQLQANACTIQGELEQAIARLTQERVRIHGAGRTDAGVHALGQVAAFTTGSCLPCDTLVKGLNHFLPQGISVREAYDVPLAFDPRRHARSRTYRYTILSHATPSPLRERYAYRMAEPLDHQAMSVALRWLEGTHDFGPLSGPVPAGKSTVRHIMSTALCKDNDLVYFEVEGNAFLPHQMRRIAGLLVAVGTGRASPEAACAIMSGHTSPDLARRASVTLPAHGLCLMKVKYEDFPPNAY